MEDEAMVEVVAGRRYRVVNSRLNVKDEGVAKADACGFTVAGWGMDRRGWVGCGDPAVHGYRVEAVDEPEALKVVAGQRYQVFDRDGHACIDACGVATEAGGGDFWVGSLAVEENGSVPFLDGYTVRVLDELAAVASPEPETTEERHAADLNDLGGNRPRLDATRLELRRLHALERIADALEVLAGTAMDAVDAAEAWAPGGDDEELDEAEAVQ